MDASSPAAVRASAAVHLIHTPSLDKVRRARLAFERRETEQQAKAIAEAFKAGRDAATAETWMAGAKLGLVCGVLLGGFGAAVLVKIFVPLGLLS